MPQYKLTTNGFIIRDGSTSIPMDLSNSEYQDYLAWVALGNVADPPDVEAIIPILPTIEERLEAAELMIDLMLDTQQGGA